MYIHISQGDKGDYYVSVSNEQGKPGECWFSRSEGGVRYFKAEREAIRIIKDHYEVKKLKIIPSVCRTKEKYCFKVIKKKKSFTIFKHNY